MEKQTSQEISVSDAELTEFLIGSFIRSFDGGLDPIERGRAMNLHQYKLQEGPLVYLEAIAGGIHRFHTDVRVMYEHSDGRREQIWCMNMIANMDQQNLHECRVAPYELRAFLIRARLKGFTQTQEKMRTGKGYSLFDIPAYEEPAPLLPEQPKRRVRSPGKLTYKETIDDSLDFFGGEEEVRFIEEPPGRRSLTLFTVYCQGGRI